MGWGPVSFGVSVFHSAFPTYATLRAARMKHPRPKTQGWLRASHWSCTDGQELWWLDSAKCCKSPMLYLLLRFMHIYARVTWMMCRSIYVCRSFLFTCTFFDLVTFHLPILSSLGPRPPRAQSHEAVSQLQRRDATSRGAAANRPFPEYTKEEFNATVRITDNHWILPYPFLSRWSIIIL